MTRDLSGADRGVGGAAEIRAVTRVDDETKWRNAGRQIGRERATLDLLAGRPKDPAKIAVGEGCHPAWGEGLRQGYREGLEARDPLQAAMGGNE
jgi:hypothetical protein